jgi:hypothetical protein
MTNRYKITLAIFFILSLLVGAHYARAETIAPITAKPVPNAIGPTTICATCGSTYTTNNTNGTTTTTTTVVTKTPVGQTTTLNYPGLGDKTVTTTNSLQTVSTSVTPGQNTGNVFTGTNFCSNYPAGSTQSGQPIWTGTQIGGGGSDLGCNYLTGKGLSSYATATSPLTDAGINVISQAYGFSQSASVYASMYFPYYMELKVTQGVTNLDTGSSVTQSANIGGVGNYASWVGTTSGQLVSPNTIIIAPTGIAQDGTSSLVKGYSSSLTLDFVSSSSNFSGVDVKNPNLSISYNYVDQHITIANIPIQTYTYCYQNVPSTCPQDLTSLQKITAPPPTPVTVSSIGTNVEVNTDPNFVMTSVGLLQINSNPLTTQQQILSLNGDPNSPMTTTIYGPTAGMPGAPGGTGMQITSTTDGSLGAGKFTSIGGQPVTSTTTASTADAPPPPPPPPQNSTSSTNGGTNANTPSTTSTTTSGSSTTPTNQTTQNTPTQSGTTQNPKTEGSQTQTANEKNVSDSKTTNASTGVTSTGDAKADAKSASIEAKVKSELAKVDRTLMTITERTRAIQDIKLEGMKASAADLSSYENRRLQDGKTMIGIPNPDFYKQINITQQQIYKDATLSAYIIKDPIAVKQRLLKEIEDEQNSIILEIEMLKKGIKKG